MKVKWKCYCGLKIKTNYEESKRLLMLRCPNCGLSYGETIFELQKEKDESYSETGERSDD